MPCSAVKTEVSCGNADRHTPGIEVLQRPQKLRSVPTRSIHPQSRATFFTIDELMTQVGKFTHPAANNRPLGCTIGVIKKYHPLHTEAMEKGALPGTRPVGPFSLEDHR